MNTSTNNPFWQDGVASRLASIVAEEAHLQDIAYETSGEFYCGRTIPKAALRLIAFGIAAFILSNIPLSNIDGFIEISMGGIALLIEVFRANR